MARAVPFSVESLSTLVKKSDRALIDVCAKAGNLVRAEHWRQEQHAGQPAATAIGGGCDSAPVNEAMWVEMISK